MRHKTIISIAGAALASILMMALIAGNASTSGQNHNHNQMPYSLQLSSSQVLPLNVTSATEYADTIAIGEIKDIRTENWTDTDHPFVQIVTIEVERYVANPLNTSKIEIRDFGEGIYDDPVHGKVKLEVTEGQVDFVVGERALVFLDYDEGNMMGDGYHVVGAHQGKYTIKSNGTAVNQDHAKDSSLAQIEKIVKETIAKKN